MIKCRFRIGLIVLTVLCLAEGKEKCEKCLPANQCSFYGNLNREEQDKWTERFVCPKSSTDEVGPLFGFASMAKGDMVCCPGNVWSLTNDKANAGARNEHHYNPQSDQENFGNNFNNNQFDYNNQPASNRASVNNYYNNNGNPNDDITNNRNSYQTNSFGNGDSLNDQGFNSNNGNVNYRGSSMEPQRAQYGSDSNNYPYQRYRHTRPNSRQSNPYFNGGNGNSLASYNTGGQCPVTSFPPTPDSGCCGREATDADRVAGSQYSPSNRFPTPNMQPNWPRAESPYAQDDSRWPFNSMGNNYDNMFPRFKRAAVNVTIDNRIAGGKETEFEQYPWTVLLRTLFNYDTRDSAFNCGGSLISSRYVLTAAHCVVEENAKLKDVKVFLAEYDKRTFPKDCKNVLGEGQKCIENIVMHAEDAIPHPQYDDSRLHNDIALLRLRGTAPYTDYIRPICLPPINVDDPDFSDLRLAVAGWGRNGQYKSDIKQSTFVNLVPNQECQQFYPHLSKAQLCAAGYSGEDTCKGDSGGPLMLLYEGKYYVSGVVSGKRADAPCGTSVPSLYTNVYEYLPWIRNNIHE